MSAELTFPTDKLVANSNITKKYQDVFHNHYLAGLWCKSLLQDLEWKTNCWRGGPAHQPKEYRAPSLSWTAVDSTIVWASPIIPLRTEVAYGGDCWFEGRLERNAIVNKLELLYRAQVWTPYSHMDYIECFEMFLACQIETMFGTKPDLG